MLVSGLASESLSSDVLMGLYLVVFLAVQYVVGIVLARPLAIIDHLKSAHLSHCLVSQIEKFKPRQRFIFSVRINFLSQCR